MQPSEHTSFTSTSKFSQGSVRIHKAGHLTRQDLEATSIVPTGQRKKELWALPLRGLLRGHAPDTASSEEGAHTLRVSKLEQSLGTEVSGAAVPP